MYLRILTINITQLCDNAISTTIFSIFTLICEFLLYTKRQYNFSALPCTGVYLNGSVCT